MNQFLDPEVRRSFLPLRTPEGDILAFISRSAGGFVSCPPYIIASVAQGRIQEDAAMTFPDSYNADTLKQITGQTGAVDKEVRISPLQATELAQIGRQLLLLHAQGQVEPPLNYFEEQSIGHLVALVDELPTE